MLAKRYHIAGYSGIVVTDHLSVSLPIFRRVDSWRERVRRFYSGYRRVRDAADRYDLVVYPGFELSFPNYPGRDYLVYGIDEELLAEMPDVCSLEPIEFKELASDVGAVVFRAHPFRNLNSTISPEYIDGLEVFNGNPRHDSHNELALAFVADHAATHASTNGLLISSGSDAHRLEDIARGGISTLRVPTTVAELAELWRDSPDEIELIVGSQRVGSAK